MVMELFMKKKSKSDSFGKDCIFPRRMDSDSSKNYVPTSLKNHTKTQWSQIMLVF